MVPDDSAAAYDRGHEAGVTAGTIEARLARHEDHFVRINGSLGDMVEQLKEMAATDAARTLAIQRLADQAEASARSVIATAEALEKAVVATANALEKADIARRNRSTQSWTAWQRAIAVIAAVSSVVATYMLIRSATRG